MGDFGSYGGGVLGFDGDFGCVLICVGCFGVCYF